MTKPPDTIYIQLIMQTWSSDRVFDNDIKYIRVLSDEEYKVLLKARRKLNADLRKSKVKK